MTYLPALALALVSLGSLPAQAVTVSHDQEGVPMPLQMTIRANRWVQVKYIEPARNGGSTILPLRVEIQRSDLTQKATFNLFLPVHGVEDVGKLQGWIPRAGDHLTIESAGFQTIFLGT